MGLMKRHVVYCQGSVLRERFFGNRDVEPGARGEKIGRESKSSSPGRQQVVLVEV